MKLADVMVDPTDKFSSLDLSKVFGKRVLRVEGNISSEFGRDQLVFELSAIVFEDGEKLFVEGEHDCAYMGPPTNEIIKKFETLYAEENGDEPASIPDDDDAED